MNSTEFDPQKANEIIKKKNLESRVIFNDKYVKFYFYFLEIK